MRVRVEIVPIDFAIEDLCNKKTTSLPTTSNGLVLHAGLEAMTECHLEKPED
jgi:hypothetical protein